MFLNPLLLAGLGGAVLPLVLHLLSLARHRDVQWGAMMFLPGIDARQRRTARLKQVVLLAVRMAIVALLAIALARPVLAANWWKRIAPAGPKYTVLLLDCSASMGFQDNGQSRFDVARRAALSILQQMASGDEVSLVLLGADDLGQPPPPTTDRRALATRLSDASVTPSRADAPAALDAALRLLKTAPAVDRRVVLITDRQATTWKTAGDAFAASWHAAIDELDQRVGSRTSFAVITAGAQDHEIIAIESAEPTGGRDLIREQPGAVEVRVRNYGDRARTGVPVALLAAQRELARDTITLPPHASVAVRLPIRLAANGSHLLTVRLGQQGLGNDDRFDLVADVVDPACVLIIGGEPSLPEGLDNRAASGGAADYLRMALAPYRSNGERGADANIVQVSSIPSAAIASLSADAAQRPDVVILCDARPASQLAYWLSRYAYDGGGVILAPDRLASAEGLNQEFYRDGAGVAPARLMRAVQDGADAPSATSSLVGRSIAWFDPTHPALSFAHGRADIGRLERAYRYFPSEPAAGARVLARLDSGDALLLERRLGRGRAVMFTMPLDARSSTLPFSNLYLPLVQSLVRYLAAGDRPPRNLLPMQPIEAELDDFAGDRAALVLPDQSRVALDVVRPPTTTLTNGTPALPRIRYDQTAQPGRYELRWRTPTQERIIHFVVRAPAEESDMTPLTNEQWESLRRRLGFTLSSAASIAADLAMSPNAAAADVASGALREPGASGAREAWPLALAVLAGLLVVESVLARAWTAVGGGES